MRGNGMGQTVSGNTVSGNDIPPAVLPAENITNNNTYMIDNTAVCDLLAALLQEETRQNETLTQLSTVMQTVSENLEKSGIYGHLRDQVLAEGTEPETGLEAEPETDPCLPYLDGILEEISGISRTVSGNNALLTSMDGTASALHEAYTEQAEKNIETVSHKLSLGYTLLFATAFIGGLVIAKIVWGRMR